MSKITQSEVVWVKLHRIPTYSFVWVSFIVFKGLEEDRLREVLNNRISKDFSGWVLVRTTFKKEHSDD